MKNTRTVLVAVGLIAVAAYVAVMVKQSYAQQQARREAIAAHHAAVTRCMELGKDMNERVQAARKAGITRTAFTEQFGEISRCKSQRDSEAPSDATHVFTDEASHRVFYLRFKDDVLMGVYSSHGPDDIQPHLPSIEQRLAESQQPNRVSLW